jgi:large subunit ribosomal protein L18
VKKMSRRAKGIHGTKERPRFAVFRSLKNISAQIIDDEAGNTIVSYSTRNIKEETKNNIENAEKIGEKIGSLAVEKGITSVVFDRRNKLYHGRIKALAEGARKAGLKF